MNDKIKDLLAKAYKTDSIAKNKWRIENREQLREQRKKELKELMEKDKTMSNNKQGSIDKEFVPYEEALALKELGFDEPCFAVYFNTTQQLYFDKYINEFTKDVRTLAPIFSQAFRWFDEHTDFMGFVVPSIKDNHFDWLIRIGWEEEIECEEAYSSRIEAELACLKQLIEIQGGDK